MAGTVYSTTLFVGDAAFSLKPRHSKHAHPAAKSAHSCFRLTSETIGNQEMCIPLQRSEPKSNKCFKCTFCPGSLKYYVYCSEEAEAEISTLSSNSVIKQAHICYEGHTLDCLH